MSWVITRKEADGTRRYMAAYRDPLGRTRSAGSFVSKRDAERAGRRYEGTLSR
jgi:hypothetical protein